MNDIELLGRKIIDLEHKLAETTRRAEESERLLALANQNDVLAELRTITGARFGQDIRLVIKCLLETRENWRKTLIGLLADYDTVIQESHAHIARSLGGYRYTDGIHREE